VRSFPEKSIIRTKNLFEINEGSACRLKDARQLLGFIHTLAAKCRPKFKSGELLQIENTPRRNINLEMRVRRSPRQHPAHCKGQAISHPLMPRIKKNSCSWGVCLPVTNAALLV
jgi:hypothetical protein